jgi:glutamine amidotransferase
MIALIDYRAGNLTSVRKAFAAVGAELYTPETAADLAGARAIVVPGVGHFGATTVLDQAWRRAILAAVGAGVPLLGICLGLQWLFEGSEEAPALPGLGVLAGRCRLLRPERGRAFEHARPPFDLKVPHVGWNALEILGPSRLLTGVPDRAQAYFTHSYVAPVTEDCVSATTHGERFASVVERGVVFGAQFHPEKSSEVGLTLLRNFLQAVRSGADARDVARAPSRAPRQER